MPELLSSLLPPRYVEYVNDEPSVLSLATKASRLPLFVACTAPVLVGKSLEIVSPVTYALPEESTAIPNPKSVELPPRYVEYINDEPSALSLVTKASPSPPAFVV